MSDGGVGVVILIASRSSYRLDSTYSNIISVPIWNLFFVEIERQAVSDNYFILGIAGLLVGFGSSYGNGCTSGHGVCGLSRGSTRSIIATVTFMFTGFLTVYILRNTLGL